LSTGKSDMIKSAVIREENGEYCVRSPDSPTWSGGCFKTKGEAEKRLSEVEYFKGKKTGFDEYFDSRMKEPNFSRAYTEARKGLDKKASDGVILRVAKAHMAAWINAINAKFFTVRWDKAKWQVEEMADGSSIPGMVSVTEGSGVIAYQMPILDKLVKSKMGGSYSLDTNVVRQFAKLQMDDKGAEVRKKLIDAHEVIFKEMASGDATGRFQAIIPELRKKLVWKKI
jgi:hypothetical protein